MSIRRRGILAAGAILVASAALSGCSSGSSLGGSSGGSSSSSSASSSGSAAAGGAITVGSANFPENAILAEIYGQTLAANGYTVNYKLNIGARAAYIPALKSGEVNLIPEYAGSILTFLDNKANAKSGADVKAALDTALSKVNLKAGALSQAADSDSLNVTPAFASTNKLSSIGDLKKVSSLTLAANPEFATRPDGIKGLKSVYGLKNITFKAINDSGGNTTLKALLGNQVQVADIYSTTPSILANKLVTLKDPKNLFASQQVVPIVSASKADTKLIGVLDKVSAALTTKDLLALNTESNSPAKPDPATIAKKFVQDKNLG